MITHDIAPTDLMLPLTVLHLRFRLRASDPISFSEQPGSAIRGALYSVLRDNFCSEAFGFGGPDHAQHCPVCWLLALENAQAQRGKDLPRPLVIEPPLGDARFAPGDEFLFGISLIGQAQELLPFIVRAVERMGREGIGRQRGRFTLCEIRECDPLLDVERSLTEGRQLRHPKLIITAELINTAAENGLGENGTGDSVTLHLLTPTRLTVAGQLLKTPEPVVFMQRLVERCQSLVENYGRPSQAEQPIPTTLWRALHEWLTIQAQLVTLVEDRTRWVEVHSGSRRLGRATPISGLVGSVRWQGNVLPLLPWLLWGQSLHVGKDAVKGNGWYRVEF